MNFTESFFCRMGSTLLTEQRSFSDAVRHAPETMIFDVFLSYNIDNQDAVKGIFFYLTKKGLKVYLDCIVDPDLNRNDTGKETARRIHNRLKHSKTLLYAQSPSAGKSNWMPWELGVVDGRTNGKCFIMPVTKDASHVTPKREYLWLYPYIRHTGDYGMRIYTEGTTTFSTDYVSYIKSI